MPCLCGMTFIVYSSCKFLYAASAFPLLLQACVFTFSPCYSTVLLSAFKGTYSPLSQWQSGGLLLMPINFPTFTEVAVRG